MQSARLCDVDESRFADAAEYRTRKIDTTEREPKAANEAVRAVAVERDRVARTDTRSAENTKCERAERRTRIDSYTVYSSTALSVVV